MAHNAQENAISLWNGTVPVELSHYMHYIAHIQWLSHEGAN